ncbi:MAG: Swarming motility regulation sensor protein RssA [Bacteroidetes bacterium ADurb.Bin174]|nr:MAG: Swarming motility regulation sensor protein RssA [Bacteroidetes bacterium ADurb.Bin174]
MAVKKLKIRPYARLLTMLGEQLIKNEQIALAELIKNSYDADADWVKISFVDFGIENLNKMIIKPESKIVIEDNGHGMTPEIIEKSWMNPATPNKRVESGTEKRTEEKRRVIQGEKGIGRFAILKLGRKIIITTRPKSSEQEYIINYDLSSYDDDFLSVDGKQKELFIDDITIEATSQKASIIIEREVNVNHKVYKKRNNQGTKIEISNLKGEWSKTKLEDVSEETQKLESIFDKIFDKNTETSFEIGFELNGERFLHSDNTIERLANLLEYNTVFKITNGKYNEKEQSFIYNINGVNKKISLNDSMLSGLRVYRDYFLKEKDLFGNAVSKLSTCGDFEFNFFIFDFNANKETKYYLDRKEKELIKKHRIYLYRDKIRVAPYGDPNDDWIGTEKLRAIRRAGDFLSNDQVVGFVDISKKNNPKLKDKTNREGLIEEGTATQDFIALLQTFLSYIRLHPYTQYLFNQKQKEEQDINKLKIVENKFSELKKSISDNPIAMSVYQDIVKSYKVEKKLYERRLELTEDLAGVGLSVETASHDIMLMLSKGVSAIDDLIKDLESGLLNEDQISNELLKIRGIFSFVNSQMKDIQLLFKSSKQRRRPIRVFDVLEKVIKIYQRSLKRENIELVIDKVGSPIVATCTDAILLQLFINLFDNAIYWLSHCSDKKINIKLDGNINQVIFSDNGSGINPEDEPYVFEAFYSGKEEGRGLGLYIARQLLQRIDYSIDVAELKSEKILSGANFVINFTKLENND